jgi:hypothetical protein
MFTGRFRTERRLGVPIEPLAVNAHVAEGEARSKSFDRNCACEPTEPTALSSYQAAWPRHA